jgi:hypothetical protein
LQKFKKLIALNQIYVKNSLDFRLQIGVY